MNQEQTPARKRRLITEPTEPEPTLEELEEMVFDGDCTAIDGCCPVDPDGYCEHGAPSWLMHLGLI